MTYWAQGQEYIGFDVEGAGTTAVVVEASTDLVNWVPIRTNTIPFGVGDLLNRPKRFYRAVQFWP